MRFDDRAYGAMVADHGLPGRNAGTVLRYGSLGSPFWIDTRPRMKLNRTETLLTVLFA